VRFCKTVRRAFANSVTAARAARLREAPTE
jgi:hypothetical protein